MGLTTGKSPYYTKLRAGNTNYYVDNTGYLETLRSDTTVLSMSLSSELQSLSFNLLLLILPSPGPSPPISVSFRIRRQTGSAHGRSPSHHSPHQVCFLPPNASRVPQGEAAEGSATRGSETLCAAQPDIVRKNQSECQVCFQRYQNRRLLKAS